MSYRIRLNTGDREIEIWDEIDMGSFKKLNPKKNDEYPDYKVNKKDMEFILSFYQNNLRDIAEKMTHSEELRKSSIMFWYNLSRYFEEININNLIENGDSFFLQYFYLVEIYRTTDREKDFLVITHG